MPNGNQSNDVLNEMLPKWYTRMWFRKALTGVDDPYHAVKLSILTIIASATGVIVGLVINYLISRTGTSTEALYTIAWGTFFVGITLFFISLHASRRTYQLEYITSRQLEYTRQLLDAKRRDRKDIIPLAQAWDIENKAENQVNNVVISLRNEWAIENGAVVPQDKWEDKCPFYGITCHNIFNKGVEYHYYVKAGDTLIQEAQHFVYALLCGPDILGPPWDQVSLNRQDRAERIKTHLKIIPVNQIEVLLQLCLVDEVPYSGYLIPILERPDLIICLTEEDSLCQRAWQQIYFWRQNPVGNLVNIPEIVNGIMLGLT